METELIYNIIPYIKPELLILVPVAYFIGYNIKYTEYIKDKYIPFILGIICIILSIIYIIGTCNMNNYMDVFVGMFAGITQGVLTAGCSGYINQLIKQYSKEE